MVGQNSRPKMKIFPSIETATVPEFHSIRVTLPRWPMRTSNKRGGRLAKFRLLFVVSPHPCHIVSRATRMHGLLKSHRMILQSSTRRVDGLRIVGCYSTTTLVTVPTQMMYSLNALLEQFVSSKEKTRLKRVENPDSRTTFRQQNLRLILSPQAFGSHY